MASGRRQECSGGDREEASHLGAGYLQKRPRKVGSRCLAHSRYSVNIYDTKTGAGYGVICVSLGKVLNGKSSYSIVNDNSSIC